MQGRNSEETPLSVLVGERGIKTSSDLSEFFTALMTDVVSGNVLAEDATAACKAGDKVIRMLELEFQHGAGEPLSLYRRTVQSARPSLPSAKPAVNEKALNDTDPNRLQ